MSGVNGDTLVQFSVGAGFMAVGICAAVSGNTWSFAFFYGFGVNIFALAITKDVSAAQHVAEQAAVNAEHFAQQAQHYAQLAEHSAQSSQAGAAYVKSLIDQMSTS